MRPLSRTIAPVLAVLAAISLTNPSEASAPPPPTDRAATTRAVARGFQTEDGYYCREVRGTQGYVKYTKVGKRHREWIPIGEIHTGPNTRGKFMTGTGVSSMLSGGLSADLGKSWKVGATFGATRSYSVKIHLPWLGHDRHKQVITAYRYQKVRINCGSRDPRTSIISYQKSPRMRYLPIGWAGRAKYRVPPPYTIVPCRSRGSEPDHKLYLAAGGQSVEVNWSHGYTASATLTGIGVSGTFSSTTSENRGIAFERNGKRKAWVCGDKSTLADSTRFYGNGYAR